MAVDAEQSMQLTWRVGAEWRTAEEDPFHKFLDSRIFGHR